LQSITETVFLRPIDTLKMSIPAILFLVHNGLLYEAMERLPVSIFQFTYQAKLILSAILSVIMLNHNYSIQQWLCLTTMSLGAALLALGSDGNIKRLKNYNYLHLPSFTTGLVAVTMACLASSFSGVYFEKILKRNANYAHGNTRASTSMWMRSIQLTSFSILILLTKPVLKLFWKSQYMGESLDDSSSIPLLHGFMPWTWALVWCQAIQGMLVIAVIGYADNVLKGMAIVMSQVMVFVISYLLFASAPTGMSNLGALTIAMSVYYFSNLRNHCISLQDEEEKESSLQQIQVV
jgi:solute carrier family 35 (UDP-sugar transporter), member A1/2/3